MTTKKKLLFVLLAISILSVAYIVYLSSAGKKNATKTPIPITGVTYNSLTPGLSTETDITKQLGTALKETQSGKTTTLEYKSTNPNFNNQLSVNSGTLSLVKQIVSSADNIFISDITQKYENYENILYKSGSSIGFNLYIYPDKGIAYLGHQGSGIVLEIWYFKPTTFDQFVNNYGQGYSVTPIQGQ